MKNPKNLFKARLAEGRQQIGIWNSIGGNITAEALAACGFDWIVIDTEHSPVEVTDVMVALQAMAPYTEVSPVVRPWINDTALIKRHLDQGAQTLLIPYVQTPDEAHAAVLAMRYPPRGVRGVAGVTRASRFGHVENYARTAEDELCLIVQVETKEAMERLEEIALVDGVDGVFIGPSDLAASMGFPGEPGHPEVKAAIEVAIGRLNAIGKPAGILTLDADFARHCMALGTIFTAVQVDLVVLLEGARKLRADFA